MDMAFLMEFKKGWCVDFLRIFGRYKQKRMVDVVNWCKCTYWGIFCRREQHHRCETRVPDGKQTQRQACCCLIDSIDTTPHTKTITRSETFNILCFPFSFIHKHLPLSLIPSYFKHHFSYRVSLQLQIFYYSTHSTFLTSSSSVLPTSILNVILVLATKASSRYSSSEHFGNNFHLNKFTTALICFRSHNLSSHYSLIFDNSLRS